MESMHHSTQLSKPHAPSRFYGARQTLTASPSQLPLSNRNLSTCPRSTETSVHQTSCLCQRLRDTRETAASFDLQHLDPVWKSPTSTHQRQDTLQRFSQAEQMPCSAATQQLLSYPNVVSLGTPQSHFPRISTARSLCM